MWDESTFAINAVNSWSDKILAMPDDSSAQEFRLHFEGPAAADHTVPALPLIQAAAALQRTFQLVAIAYEGEEPKQRLRASRDMERKYSVVFGVPKDGGYTIPYRVGGTSAKLFDPDDIAKVQQQHEAVLSAVQTGDATALRRALPSALIRRAVIRELKRMQPPPRSGLVVSIEDYQGRKLLDGHGASERIAPLLAESDPHVLHPRIVTGLLDALEFQTRTLRLQLPNGRLLTGTYNDDFEPVLLDNRREWIQVRGDAILAEDDTLKSLVNITEVIEVDTSPVVVERFSVGEVFVEADRPVTFEVDFVPEDGLYFATGEFHMMVTAQLKDDLEKSVMEALEFLWREYVYASPHDLTDDALVLRDDLLDTFAEVRNAV
jgi:hypothetical protein